MFKAGLIAVAAMLLVAATPIPSPKSADRGRPLVANGNGSPANEVNVSQPKSKPLPGAASDHPIYVEAACDHGCGYAEDVRTWIQKFWTDPNATFAGFLVLFTFVLMGASISQSRQITRQSDIAERSLHILEGPYLYPIEVEFNISRDRVIFEHEHIALKVKDFGRTPAVIILATGKLRFGPDFTTLRNSKGKAFDSGEQLVQIIGPDDPVILTFGLDSDTWSEEIREAFRAGKTHLFFACDVIFRDVFNRLNRFGYCVRYTWKGGRTVRDGGDEYNYFDRNIEYPPKSSMSLLDALSA